jgi:HAE1 family hydrophobic/amphiphilic exporter-1
MLVLFASILVLGTVAVMNIPLELIPEGASMPFMSVNVPYSNATAQDVEEKITRPLEQSLATMPALDRISATSTSSNARINLVYENDADMDIAYREVRDRISRVRPELPDDVKEIKIQKHTGDGIAVAFYGVSWPESMDNPQDLLDRHLMRKIERVEGVGMVSAWGQQDREIRIEIDRGLAEAAKLNIFQVAQTLSRSHFNLASGQVVEAEDKFLLRSMGRYNTIGELENAVVGPNDLRLGDIAEVLYEYPDIERYDRYNGRPTMAIFVIKESQANTVEVSDAIKAAVDEASKDPALAQFEIEKIFIQGDTIRSSLKQVTDSGLQGGFLALFVLLFFLRRLRLTVVIALAIPLSMFMALPFMYFSGQSINLVSLIGLMICIGLVVDNSVVVAENIARYRARGVGRFAAALHGASEVALPIILATATTMVVFLPAALMNSGTTQFFMVRMVTPICVSLLASLFVALVLIPLAAAFVLEKEIVRSPDAGSFRGKIGRIDAWWKRILGRLYEMTFGKLCVVYGKLLRLSLRRRIDVVLVSGLALAATVAVPMHPEKGVKLVLGENMGGRQVSVNYTVPSHVSIDESDAFCRDLEGWFAEHRHEWNGNGEYFSIEPGFTRIQIFFNPQKDGDPPYKEAGKEVIAQLPTPVGWVKNSEFRESDGARATSFPVVIFGSDHESVQNAKEEFERRIVEVDGVLSVIGKTRDTSRRDELHLSLDPAMSERLGVSPGMVANTVSYALRGSPLPRFQGPDREIDVWIRYKKSDREELKDLLQFKVPTQAGTSVPIRTVTETDIHKGEAVLVRDNKRVASLVRLELDPERRQEAMMNVMAFLDGYRLPDGLSFDADEEMREVEDQQRDMLMAMMLGTIFIFLLMGFLFESLVLPLSVLPAIPLSFVGVWWFLYLTRSNLDPLAIIGLLLLLGVVVNNAIVLVDFINSARASGLERSEAIVQAGIQRFRPIFMTALTTVGGMLPLAFADAPAEGIPYGPFGKTLVGGMTTATILTLVVVPVSYTAFDDLRNLVRRWATRMQKWVR